MTATEKIEWPGWETVRLIGRGSIGAVYEIQQKVQGNIERAALKVIAIPQDESDIQEMRADGYSDAEITAEVRRQCTCVTNECKRMQRLKNCPNIVRYDDVRWIPHEDGIGQTIVIKMELLAQPISCIIAEKRPILEQDVVRLGMAVCNALSAAHSVGIVHGNLKPHDVLMTIDGNFKVNDFGILRTIKQVFHGPMRGTYHYTPPEIYNNLLYCCTADIYSLGMIMYRLLNEGRIPFMCLPPAKVGIDEIFNANSRRLSGEPLPPSAHGSDRLKQVVLKACAYDSKDRYQSAQEMYLELLQLSGQDTQGVDSSMTFLDYETALERGNVHSQCGMHLEQTIFSAEIAQQTEDTANPIDCKPGFWEKIFNWKRRT